MPHSANGWWIAGSGGVTMHEAPLLPAALREMDDDDDEKGRRSPGEGHGLDGLERMRASYRMEKKSRSGAAIGGCRH